jgi:hypothetical protein
VARFLLAHDREDGGDTMQDAAQIDVDHPVPPVASPIPLLAPVIRTTLRWACAGMEKERSLETSRLWSARQGSLVRESV